MLRVILLTIVAALAGALPAREIPGVSTGPWGRRGCSWGGSPQSRGSGAQPQEGRRRFFGAFLTDFHEVLLLFWDQLKPKNGYKYSHSSC